jgi:prepilin-type N-terminal cleavage/methylation domain-containing protein
MKLATNDESGFTLPELISVLAVSAIFVALILYFGISYWRYSALLESDLDTFVSRLNAQDIIREFVGTSDGLITQNSIQDAHANNPDPVAGANYWVTIHAVPGTLSAASGSTTPVLYFRRLSINTSNAIIMNGTQPYEDEYVLYLNGTTRQLLLRTLANSSATDNKAKTSCPAAIATTACPADKIVLENVASLDATYYSRSGSTLSYDSTLGTPDFPLVEALQYTFHITKKTLFQTSSSSTVNNTVVRIALRNT